MDLTNLTTKDLNQISRLVERKESLREQIDEINRALASIGTSTDKALPAPEISKVKRAGRAGKRAKRKTAGRVTATTRKDGRKEQIIGALKEAGKQGLHVKDIAEKIGSSKGSVNVWVYTTAKKIPNIQQAGPGRFRWVNGA